MLVAAGHCRKQGFIQLSTIPPRGKALTSTKPHSEAVRRTQLVKTRHLRAQRDFTGGSQRKQHRRVTLGTSVDSVYA